MLYIETFIRADLEQVWRLTQDPDQHQRWDLRFTRIKYQPGTDPQRFRCAVTVFPGLTVSGTGVTVAERVMADGSRTSALRFTSSHPLSLIRDGSGYWRYVPTEDGVRFLTGYHYRPGWRRFGRVAGLLFRPLLGWATAWSFDRLRLWLEDGVPPETSLRRAALDLGARAAVCAGVWWLARLPAAVVTAAGLALVPPAPATPAARRCLRRPPDRRSRTAPAELSTLEPS